MDQPVWRLILLGAVFFLMGTGIGCISGVDVNKSDSVINSGESLGSDEDDSDTSGDLLGSGDPPKISLVLKTTIHSPDDSVTIQASVDEGGSETSLQWIMLAGPVVPGVESLKSETLKLTHLEVGDYYFQLTATNEWGEDSKKTWLRVNQPPVLFDVTSDTILQHPEDSIVLQATGMDDGIIVEADWTQVSGPVTSGSVGLIPPDTLTLSLSDLEVGTYGFQISATDDDGASAQETVTVVVLEEEPSGGKGGLSGYDYEIPPEKTHGPATHLVQQDHPSAMGSVTVLATGEKFYSECPLKEAIEMASPGDAIGVLGYVRGTTIGEKKLFGCEKAGWDGNAVVRDITIGSAEPYNPATIRNIALTGNIENPGGGGMDEILIKNLTLTNIDYSANPMSADMGSRLGSVYLYDIDVRPEDESAWNGWGMKWNFRFHGLMNRIEMRNVSAWGALEHVVYADSVGWKGDETSGVYLDGVKMVPGKRTGRTGFQFVDRKNESGDGYGGKGPMIIRNCVLDTGDGPTEAEGGSAITIVGRAEGDIYIDDCTIYTELGGMAIWTDEAKGVYLTPSGYSHRFVLVRNTSVIAPNSDRSHFKFAGIEHLVIEGFLADGNRTALDLWDGGSGSIDNGLVQIYSEKAKVSDDDGFQSGIKMKYKDQIQSDEQIDAYAP